MPFGLCNVPATFQKMMNEIFHDMLDEGVVAFIDDILIYTNGTKQEHEAFVCKVLDRLLKYRLCIAIEKCEFSVSELSYLGHILSGKGVRMDPDRIKAVLDWPVPKNKKEVQQFNGFANFYRRFVKSYAHINGPIAELLSGTIFTWGPRQQKAFEYLKKVFTTAPMVRHFDPNLQAIMETDASNYAIGAVLSQRFEKRLHPVAFYSRKMILAEQNYDIHDKEILAIV
jgi:hypothetical protein